MLYIENICEHSGRQPGAKWSITTHKMRKMKTTFRNPIKLKHYEEKICKVQGSNE